MNRGSRICPRGATGEAGRFNEAPIHESGKFVVRPEVQFAAPSLQ